MLSNDKRAAANLATVTFVRDPIARFASAYAERMLSREWASQMHDAASQLLANHTVMKTNFIYVVEDFSCSSWTS